MSKSAVVDKEELDADSQAQTIEQAKAAGVEPPKVCDDEEGLDADIQAQIIEQAKVAEIKSPKVCTDEERAKCAVMYGDHAVENKILISISENINIMATAINNSEAQKQKEREGYVKFFKGLLRVLVFVVIALVSADTFLGCKVRVEFLISVMVAILADIFAIVHTIVKYMTNVEHYDAYNKLIDSLLKHIDYGKNGKNS